MNSSHEVNLRELRVVEKAFESAGPLNALALLPNFVTGLGPPDISLQALNSPVGLELEAYLGTEVHLSRWLSTESHKVRSDPILEKESHYTEHRQRVQSSTQHWVRACELLMLAFSDSFL